MGKERREKEPGFIKFANSPQVSPPVAPAPQPATDDIKNRFSDALVELKRLSQVSRVPQVEETHARLVNLLTSIIKNQSIEDGENLRFFLQEYNSSERFPIFILEGGKIVKAQAMLVQPSVFAIHNFVEFLASQNLKKIKKCPSCGKFFVAKRARKDNKYCSPRCRLAFHNRERIKSGKAKEYMKNGRKMGKYQ